MIYPASSRARFPRSPFAILLGGVILVWLFNQPSIYNLGERLVLTIARPFLFLGASGLEWLAEGKQFWASRAALQNENDRLRQNLSKLMVVEAERARLAADNQSLRAFFNYRAKEDGKTITAARILTRVSQSPFDAVIADIGSENTVKSPQIDDLVVGNGRVALGRVITVAARTVKIELYSSWNTRHEVAVGAERLPATAIGRGSGNFSISLPRDLTVKIGDPIAVIRGTEEYLLGTVKVINRNPSDPFQEILFRSPVNLELLSWVEIYGA